MKRFIAAAILFAVIAGAAQAQLHSVTDQSSGGRMGPPPAGLSDGERVDEKAYESAVKRIPADTKKIDPWQSVRDKSTK
jgi:hypothetical protein